MQFYIIRRKLQLQNIFGFYKSGIKNEQIWYGFEIPFLDFRVIIYV